MERGLHKILYIIVFTIFFSLSSSILFSSSERDTFLRIQRLADSKNSDELKRTAKKFLKKYPKSNNVADVRLILAESEWIPKSAIDQYRILVDKYRYYNKRDYAQNKVCEILYLLSKWRELREESLKGISIFEKSSYYIKFHLFLAKACIKLERYDEALGVCLKATKLDHRQENLSQALLMLSFISRKTTGFSRGYLNNLNELITGFDKSDKLPVAIYLLGSYYDEKNDYNRAYSAFIDLTKRFPKSPEAYYASRRIDRLKIYNPSKIDYIPNSKIIQDAEKIDIHPYADIDDVKRRDQDFVYAVSIGYFNDIKHAREIKRQLKNNFKPLKIVKIRNRYLIYVGRLANIDRAVSTKIRLAEEFGMNGNIVKMIKDNNKLYIHEE